MKLGNSKVGDQMAAELLARSGLDGRFLLDGKWKVEAFRDGKPLFTDYIENIIVNEGLDDLLDVYLNSGTQTTTWYVGLTDGTPTVAAGDTMSSHAGWTEITAYDEATRPTWVGGSVSSQSIDNSASKASFSINSSTTVGGAFLTSNNTKGGSTGTLFAVGAFTGGDRSGLQSGDTLEVTATFTSADDGS